MTNGRLALALIALGPFKTALGPAAALAPESAKPGSVQRPDMGPPAPPADQIKSLAREWLKKR